MSSPSKIGKLAILTKAKLEKSNERLEQVKKKIDSLELELSRQKSDQLELFELEDDRAEQDIAEKETALKELLEERNDLHITIHFLKIALDFLSKGSLKS